MRVYGLTANEIEHIVSNVASWYAGNLRVNELRDHHRKDRKVVTFTLRTKNSHIEPSRLAPSGRHTIAANWQAHYNVMNELFLAGATRITSRLADYKSYNDFMDHAQSTRHANVGSHMFPVSIGEL